MGSTGVCLFTVLFVIVPNLAVAGQYSGQWEYQALNAGDTYFNAEQSGSIIKLYRVLYPEYQGSRFKLEHIYKGKIRGHFISGFLFVREQGMKDFEKLRDFRGKIHSANEMVIDDLPLKRISSELANSDSLSEHEISNRFSKVVIKKGARKNQAARVDVDDDADKKTAIAQDDKSCSGVQQVSGQTPPGKIPKLIPVRRKIVLAVREKTDQMLARGDSFYKAKHYNLALQEYSTAFRKDSGRLELLYKLGLCHGVLGNMATRTGKKDQAVKHYLRAIDFWSKASRLDPYNKGAEENIKRAKNKLEKIGKG